MAVTVNKRETWSGKLDFILALIGFSVGLGNIWRFPYLCYKNGGGCFLIPYGICLILAGVPILILEVALGQFTSSGGITAWNIVPLFQGIGYASVVVVQWLNIYYIVILGWALYYMFASFTSVLPWSHCDNYWNTDRCVDSKGRGRSILENGLASNASNMSMAAANATENITKVSSSQEFWENRVLQISNGLEEPGSINWEMALCLLLGWIICYLCVWKGVKSTGKVVYFTATFPYVLLIILMIRAVTLDGAIDGIKFYVNPNFTRLQDGQVWLDAGTQVFFSYSIGLGTLIALGSYNKFHNNLYRDCIIFSIVNSGTSFWGGFVIFSILGFMAKKQGVDVGTVAESGPGLAFIAYPAAVTEMPVAPLWSILFFFMVILLGLDSEALLLTCLGDKAGHFVPFEIISRTLPFVGVEGFVTAIVDLYPDYLRKGYRKEIFIGVMSIFWFLIGLSMVTNGGMYVFQLFDAYSASGSCLLWIAVFQCIGIGWFYGGDRFYDNMADMIGFRINPWLRICWFSLSPVFCMAIFIFSLVTYEPLNYNKKYLYPPWAQALGWIMALSSILCIPLVAIIKLVMTEGTFRERWVKLTTPNPPIRDPEEEVELSSIDSANKPNPDKVPVDVAPDYHTGL